MRRLLLFGGGLWWLLRLVSASLAQTPTPPPLNAPLIATNIPDQSGILLIDIQSGEQRLLSFGRGNHYLGDFSPDGCEIVFTWEAELGQGELYAARLDGTGLRQLTFVGNTGALSYLAWEPQWSPDGSRIVYAFVRYYDPPNEDPYRTSHIAWIPATGGTPAYYSNSGTEWQPRWSPDGQWLVYVSVQAVVGGDLTETGEAPIKPELWLVDINGQNKRRLTSFGEGGAFNPRWSPNGDRIAFIYEPLPNSHQMMVMAVDGVPFVLHDQQAMVLDYTWQPTGRNLVAAIRGLGGQETNILWQLPTQANTVISPFLPEPSADYPRYSADGRWLAFRSSYELTLYDTASTEMTYLGEQTGNNSPPVWSPVGFNGEAACE